MIWLSGPTGSGKTTLASFVEQVGYNIVREVVPIELFRAFSIDPARNCALVQDAIMRSRLEQWTRFSSTSNIAFDRSLEEDWKIFCRMHHEHGLLSEDALASLKVLADELQASMPAPDLIVYMRPDARVLYERMGRGGHPGAIIESLGRQISLYDEWINTKSGNVIRIDNGNCAVQAIQGLFRGNRIC